MPKLFQASCGKLTLLPLTRSATLGYPNTSVGHSGRVSIPSKRSPSWPSIVEEKTQSEIPISTINVRVTGHLLNPTNTGQIIKPGELVDFIEITPLNRSELVMYNQLLLTHLDLFQNMNGKQHRQIGAATGAIYTVAKYLIQKSSDPNMKFSWGELALNTGIGYVAGIIPDLLEPALHSRHRKFFHSVTAGAAATYGAFGKHTEEWDDSVKKRIQVVAVADVSHLAADATIPCGIAMIHPNFV